MRVHLPRLNLDEFRDIPVDEFVRLAASDRFGEHELVASADESDLILFSQAHMLWGDWRIRMIREHPLVRLHPERCLVYDERDRPWCGMPGVYVSMPQSSFHPDVQRAWGYFRFPDVERQPAEPDLLFSFVGSPSDPSRRPLLALRHPDAVVESVDGFIYYDPQSKLFAERVAHFATILNRSRFVLCPRGQGVSSLRLYQVLSLGRVPVVIADDWVPPAGVDWSSFSIRWPEGQIDGLVRLLEERDVDWEAMSAAALDAYRTHFAPDVSFHRIVELCRGLLETGNVAGFPRRGLRDRAYVAAGTADLRYRATMPLRSWIGRTLRRLGWRP